MIRFKFKSNFTKSYIDARYRTIHNVDITFSLTTAVAAAVAFFQRIIRRRAEKEIKTKRATKQTRSCLKDEQEKERVNLGLRVWWLQAKHDLWSWSPSSPHRCVGTCIRASTSLVCVGVCVDRFRPLRGISDSNYSERKTKKQANLTRNFPPAIRYNSGRIAQLIC